MQKKSKAVKIIALALALTLAVFFTACSNGNVNKDDGTNGGNNEGTNEGTNGDTNDSTNGGTNEGTSESGINSMSLEEIMDAIYAVIPEDELPKLGRTEITADNTETFLGTPSVEFTEGLASEPMMSSIAHSVCLIRVADGADIDATLKLVKENAKPGKWICVMVEDQYVYAEKNGNVVALIMVNDYAPEMAQAFLDIK